MARYFFDAGDSNAVIKGEVGIECDGIVAARREAMEGLIFGLLRHVQSGQAIGDREADDCHGPGHIHIREDARRPYATGDAGRGF
ncbi:MULTISPECIES: hypothetical protein [unclassified Mesorhizobium]|uniref:DUF6894 family protein n=1 Tax=unclassified Mesorhizobium TaxID=325217 RepID=UPI001FEDE839|nr:MULTISPECIES: hypothetical protein [unclassified Mesorhizobium]